MFIVHKKRPGPEDGSESDAIIYGYGGFDISLDTPPAFSPLQHRAGWSMGGRLRLSPIIRGGGEYGKEWHDAGAKLKNKQNVFDDFIAAAEWLIANKYTSIARNSRCGGGSRTAACSWVR